MTFTVKTISAHIKLRDLWIGDSLRVMSTGRLGTFEGIGKNGKARLKCGDKIFLISEKNLELIPEKEMEPSLDIPDIEKGTWDQFPLPTSKNQFDKNEIDLHIEKLNPDLENAHPQLILDHQLEMCRAFVEHAISKKRNVVTIIHGKGTGILKEEVIQLLKEFSNVRFSIGVNGEGAQEVWFKY